MSKKKISMKNIMITKITHQKLDLIKAGAEDLKTFDDTIMWLITQMEEKYT